MTERPIAAYIFVDAAVPEDGKSRLDLMESPQAIAQFRGAAVNGLLPTWTDVDLREAIPGEEVRSTFVSELHPMPLAVYSDNADTFCRILAIHNKYLSHGFL